MFHLALTFFSHASILIIFQSRSLQSKDQLKALKAQKAAAAAQQQATTAAVGRDEDTKSMPPPPPRPASLPPPSAPLQKPSDAAGPGSYHQDSQGTRINDGGGITASRLQSEPSVNKQIAPQHNINNINNNNNTSLVDSNTPLPTGFFEAAVAAQGGQGSTGGGLSLERVVSKGAKSGEGSTGAALGGIDRAEMRSGASVGDFLVATSQLSAMEETELNQIAPAISHALQAETSQQKIIQSNNKKDKNIVVERPGTSSKQQQLPNGFFDTASIAPQGTKASAAAGVSTQDGNMEKEFANFMKEVNVNAAQTEAEVGAEAAGAVEDDDEGDRRARDDFEQLYVYNVFEEHIFYSIVEHVNVLPLYLD